MKRRPFNSYRFVAALVVFAVLAIPAASQSVPAAALDGASTVESGSLLLLDLPASTSWKRMPKNSRLEGCLALPVYAGEQVAISAGAELDLTISSVERVHDHVGAWKKTGRVIVRAFNPLDKRVAPEYIVKLSSAQLISPDGEAIPLDVTVLRAGRTLFVQPKVSRNTGATSTPGPASAARRNTARPQQRMLLRLEAPMTATINSNAPATANIEDVALTTRTRARAFLLTDLSASRSHKDDLFQASLAEPVRLGGYLFEAGSVLEGRVLRSTPPRILSRAGSLHLRVERITSREGQSLVVPSTLDEAEADARGRFVVDEEGTMRGVKPGFAHAVVDLGIAYSVGKLTDDLAETPIRAIGAAMSDAAVANAARYFGLGTSAVFLVTRHGRDVRLAKYSEIEVDFGRVANASASNTPPSN